MSPLNGVLAEAWDLYRRFAAHFLLIAFVIYVITAILVALFSLGGLVGAFIGSILSLAATGLVQASLIKAVQDVRDGRVDLDLGETVRAAVPFILPVIVASILAWIGIAIGLALIIVPGLILLTYWCLIIPFIVIGGSGVFGSFGHSWRTVRGYAWRVFGTLFLVWLIMVVSAFVLSVIFLFVPLWLRSFVDNIVVGTLVAPFLALVLTLIYYRLTAAHAGQPYVPTGPAGATGWQPPSPTGAPGPPTAGFHGPPPADYREPPPADYREPPPADYREPPPADYREPPTADYREPPPAGSTAPGATAPDPAEPGPAEAGPVTPPDPGPDEPPPPSAP